MGREIRKTRATEQLTKTLRQRIRRGTWQVGKRMPSVRSLATEFEVSTNTVQRTVCPSMSCTCTMSLF